MRRFLMNVKPVGLLNKKASDSAELPEFNA